MSDAGAFKLIELVVLSGAVAGFCFWQFRTLARLKREREQADGDARQADGKRDAP